jgi:hypothetical protein
MRHVESVLVGGERLDECRTNRKSLVNEAQTAETRTISEVRSTSFLASSDCILSFAFQLGNPLFQLGNPFERVLQRKYFEDA